MNSDPHEWCNKDMTYRLGVDLGTTFTAAALERDGKAEIVPLGNHSAEFPSVLFRLDHEQYLVGEAAIRRGIEEPGRMAREFKRRHGDDTAILLGGSPQSSEALTARLLRWTVDAVSQRQGQRPDRLVVTYPANWGPYRTDLFMQAIRAGGVDEPDICSEPEAAAVHFASTDRVAPGAVVAIYDLGGGTFDAAVLRRTSQGFDILGRPDGIEHLGGVDFDVAILAHVNRSVDGALETLDPGDPVALAALSRLRRDCVEAKEALSSDTDVRIPVAIAGIHRTVRLTRAEFEEMIAPNVADTVQCMRRAIESAALTVSDISTIVLVGGSARIPLVSQVLASELGRPIALSPQVKHSVALGAVLRHSLAAAGRPATSRKGKGDVQPPPAPPASGTEPPVAPPGPRPEVPRSEVPRPEVSVEPVRATSPRVANASLRWRAVACLALVLIAVALAFAGPTDTDQSDPGAAGLLLNGADISRNKPVSVSFDNIQVTAPGKVPRNLQLMLGGRTLAEGQPGTVAGSRAYGFPNQNFLIGGPVHGVLDYSVGKTNHRTEFILVPKHGFRTIPGIALVVAALFVVAYAEALLRPMRRRRRVRAGDIIGVCVLGLITGCALVDAAWVIGKRLLPSTAVITIVLMITTAFALLPSLLMNSEHRRAQ